MIVKNKKTGIRYIILEEDIINATNNGENKLMVLYVEESQASLNDPQLYVREKEEFNQKFENI
jgi:hypothetical protein